MRKIAPFFWLFAALVSQTEADVSHINQIVHQTYLSQYDSAQVELALFNKSDSNSLAYQTYSHFVMQMKLKDFEDLNDNRSDSLLAAMEATLELLGDAESAFNYHLLGTLFFVKAAEEQRRGNYYTALRNGYSAEDAFENAKKLDKSLGDVNLGIGIFKYWKSVHTKNIPFFSNEKEEALKLLSHTSGFKFSSDLASKQQLIYIWLEENHVDSAMYAANEMVQKYPNAPHFLWAKAYALFKKNRYQDSYSVYNELYQHYKNKSEYNELELQRKMSICLKRMGDFDKALSHITMVKLRRTGKQDRLADKLDQILDLEEEIRDEIERKK